jgi:integrase
MRQPVRCPRTGLWLARYTAADGRVVQVGRFERKRDAQSAIADAIRKAPRLSAEMPLADFFSVWLDRFPRHPRTQQTNRERIESYILPHLPRQGRLPINELRRSMLRDVQAQLLGRGLSKETIDGALSSLSAMLRDAVDDELLDANPAQGLRVRPNDPRLNPSRAPHERRAVPATEVGAFMQAVPPRYRAVCWTPFLTGVRPGELFGLERADLDRSRQMIYVHQTIDRYGKLEAGLKTTHHVRDRERRGRWTLFPAGLINELDAHPAAISGRMYPSPRGRYWAHRNFYRDVWEPAKENSGVNFTLYDARHTFSSRLLAAGIPLVEVAAWMGHSLRAGGEQLNTTTRTYAHATGEMTDLALAELASFYAAATHPIRAAADA